jgi:hypothetical protein
MYPECFVVITGWKSYQSPVIGSINDSFPCFLNLKLLRQKRTQIFLS